MACAALLLIAGAVAPADAARRRHRHPASTVEVVRYSLGNHRHPISTRSIEAQRHFNDGLNWMWAFNLEEAQRSFEAATRADSNCAMCWWGVALSLGPHINVPAIAERTVAAAHAVARATQLESRATAPEKALIGALSKRYSDPAPADTAAQRALDQGYADAMRDVARRFPNDLDIQALWVESMLDLRPWDYWTPDGSPQPGTLEIVATLEHILARDPRHPGANHYYIHAIEASPHPEKALEAAKRLGTLMPASGHLTHMPFHIYFRVGQYEKAEEANRRAVDADLNYASKVEVPMFMHMYTAHDFHSLSFCQTVLGKSQSALRNARAIRDWLDPEMAKAMPGSDFFLAVHELTLARFGRWDEILAAHAPPAGLPYLAGVHHYVRGLALAGKGDLANARAERDTLATIRATVPPGLMEDLCPAAALLEVQARSLEGEIAAHDHRVDDAVAALRQGVAKEDSLHYSEPPDWPNPLRLSLGAVLLDAGRAADAEAVYRAHLERWPEDPWGLFGLALALEREGKDAEASDLRTRFAKAWAGADVKLSASRF